MESLNYLDFHCHLDAPQYDEDRDAIIERCLADGYYGLVTVANPYQADSLAKTAAMCAAHSRVWAMAAAHPHEADHYTEAVEEALRAFAAQVPLLAVGECGLDFHYDFSSRASQERVFRRQIALAREWRLPLVIHARQAEMEILAILAEEQFSGPVVFHCYTGTLACAQLIAARGYFISLSGIVTFKKAAELHDVARVFPLQQLFSETDSPYLAPDPFRGRTNSPQYIPHIVAAIAALKGLPVQTVAEAIARNFSALFPQTKQA